MAVEGSLDIFRLPEILQVVSHQRKTGILTVQGESDIVAVSFLDGSIVAADSLNRTVEEKLGEVLEREGLAGRESFAEVAAAAQQGEGRLFDLLVARGVVEREGLLAAMRAQTYDLLFELLVWESGEFKFYSGDEVSYEEGFKPIAVEELLLRAIAESEDEEEAALPAGGVLYILAEPAPCEVRERVGPPRPGEDGGGVLWVSPEEERLRQLLAEPQSVEALIATTGLGEHKVRFALYRFLAAGVAETHEPEEADEPAPLTAPPPLPEPSPAAPPASSSRRASAAPAATAAGAASPALLGVEMPGEDTLAGLAPPVEAPEPRRRPRRPPRTAVPRPAAVAVPALVAAVHLAALGLALAAAIAVLREPIRLLLPFPWQEQAREVEAAARFDAAATEIDRAAKTWYLLEGVFPRSLGPLSGAGLLAGGDLAAPGDRPYVYLPSADAYRLRPADSAEDAGLGEAISGNFLLDADFQATAEAGQSPPLVLLD